jgi:hypothetical protein
MAAGDMLEEDVAMLRQILDNLLAFLISKLWISLEKHKSGCQHSIKTLKFKDLKQQFKHVDDSLFAMSLRNPK